MTLDLMPLGPTLPVSSQSSWHLLPPCPPGVLRGVRAMSPLPSALTLLGSVNSAKGGSVFAKCHRAGKSMTHRCHPWGSGRLFLGSGPMEPAGLEAWHSIPGGGREALSAVPGSLTLPSPQGHKRKNWKVRRFVLRKEPAFLHYYDPSKVSTACSRGPRVRLPETSLPGTAGSWLHILP